MDEKAIANVFISHRHEDDARLKELKDLLAKNGCTVRDSSVSSATPNQATDPEYIKREILGPGIRWAGVVVVLISPETRASSWVNWEIEYAHAQNKRIVGVWDFGARECDLPDALDEFANAVVGWRADRISGAILGEINDWETPSGEPCEKREITRYRC